MGSIISSLMFYSLSYSIHIFVFVQMQKNSTEKNGVRVVKFNDISFPCLCPYADYDTVWTSNFNDRTLINVTSCYESSVLFAAREPRLYFFTGIPTKIAPRTTLVYTEPTPPLPNIHTQIYTHV